MGPKTNRCPLPGCTVIWYVPSFLLATVVSEPEAMAAVAAVPHGYVLHAGFGQGAAGSPLDDLAVDHDPARNLDVDLLSDGSLGPLELDLALSGTAGPREGPPGRDNSCASCTFAVKWP